ncbi:MAG: 50S ribosomal protein L17 [Deltaproteobacteria bacterium CG_4_10_14_0_2_um_filter_43_8]|nr:MAG: 50S ribosomal protein L17 [Deltaproteobacteria bacterium CG11_big_fil_rev_8_21_14_0_20_42_23]PJA21580.1 MAG: 50S ribosomal protein L17 [Deltaproteobacteria bacterium CG_4_10_14_0_2_um_filter_43_8]PJC64608.1 MAG: 50S ribosomal protein L17 [Deltaproteobacteria bacterium CG_4_9_14_0_2_um_filter_42_21]
MRHRNSGRKLGMKSAHRKAMFANMVSSLIMHDRIETTLPKAKELRCIADKLVTLSKEGTLHARRRALALIRDKAAVEKAFSTLAERFATRQGGYTRIYRLGFRHGDAAPMALIEYLNETSLSAPAPTKEKAKKSAEASTKEAAPKKKATKKAAPKKKAAAKKA